VRAPAPVELWIGSGSRRTRRIRLPRELAAAGFEQIDIEPTRIYTIDDANRFLTAQSIDVDALAPHADGSFARAFIRATKPVGEVESRH